MQVAIFWLVQTDRPELTFNSGRYELHELYEESRMHIHITCEDGEAKFWLEPVVALARYTGLSVKQLREIQKIVEERNREITSAWGKHFKA